MRQNIDDNMVFHTKAQITNKNNSSKIYDNVLVIKDGNFNNDISFLMSQINTYDKLINIRKK
jgi:hypothetical protein